MKQSHAYCAGFLVIIAASAVQAKQITFSGTVEAGCTMQVDDGELGIDRTYSLMGTEQNGGSPARLTVTTIGGPGQVSLSKPQWGGFVPKDALPPEIRFTSNRGKTQGYTSSDTPPVQVNGGDVFEVHARSDNAFGFQAGDYQITTIATCTG